MLALAIAWAAPAGAQPAFLEAVARGDHVLAAFPLAPGERWCVLWHHSVQGFEVRDCYVYRDDRMVLERSHQPDYAAGLGPVVGRGRPRSDGRGGYWIEDIDEPVPGDGYILRVGSSRVDHRIAAGGRIVSLSALAAGEAVTIRVYRSDETRHEDTSQP
ncbi:DUF1850 domain-containing protein [Arhodomonas sp. AD133]|uniref:DUF1850 domain-containing protein n=1 Tax=Arhodomonas sp. AD133 TaxID=3415009 RepID=UPI003EB874ED